jgi:enoyl-CoA hydratase
VPIELDRDGPVAILTLNRPEALNALSEEMLDALAGHLRELDADPGARAVIITGAGEKAFCAGADIGRMRTADVLEARAFGARGQALAARVEDMGTPVVAAVNGYALGGGCELALACDIRMAAETARFGQPEVTLGIVPGWGGTQRLARATSMGFAKDLVLTGRMVGAEEALRTGLATHVHPREELLDRAVELARTLAARPSWAVATAKALCNLALGELEGPLARELDGFAIAFATEDQREGMAAFLDKRPPRFAGHEAGDGR